MSREMLKQKLTSRKFWLAVASGLFIVLSEGLELNIDKDLYWKLVAVVLGYIFGEAIVDVARAKARGGEEIDAGEKVGGTE